MKVDDDLRAKRNKCRTYCVCVSILFTVYVNSIEFEMRSKKLKELNEWEKKKPWTEEQRQEKLFFSYFDRIKFSNGKSAIYTAISHFSLGWKKYPAPIHIGMREKRREWEHIFMSNLIFV